MCTKRMRHRQRYWRNAGKIFTVSVFSTFHSLECHPTPLQSKREGRHWIIDSRPVVLRPSHFLKASLIVGPQCGHCKLHVGLLRTVAARPKHHCRQVNQTQRMTRKLLICVHEGRNVFRAPDKQRDRGHESASPPFGAWLQTVEFPSRSCGRVWFC